MKLNRGEEFKEICAHYGAAMYFAQVLEHGIANALLFLDLIPKTSAKYSAEEFDTYYEGQFDKTLGNLIRTLSSVTNIPEELDAALRESKDRRAYLAHHYFREKIDDFYLDKYQKCIEELESHREFFHATDKMLYAFVLPVMKKFGFTEEKLEIAVEEYKGHLLSRSID